MRIETIEAIKRLFDEHRGDLRVLDFPISAADFTPPVEGDAIPVNAAWHTVAISGSWDGHFMGAFSVNKAKLEQMRDNFDATKTDLVVDYEHNSLNPIAGESPAAGWISAMVVEDSDEHGARLRARVKWTDRAAAMIRADEYRHVSPTIIFNSRDRKTGADTGSALHSVALTNTPFLDDLPEIRLNSFRPNAGNGDPSEGETMDPKKYAALCVKMGLTVEASADDLIAAADAVREENGSLRRICESVGVAPDDPMKAEGVILALVGRVEVAEAAEAAAIVAAAGADAEARFIRAEGAGFVDATNDAFVRSLATDNPEGFEAWFAVARPIVPLDSKRPKGSTRPAPESSGDPKIDAEIAKMSDADRATAEMLGLSAKDFVRHNMI